MGGDSLHRYETTTKMCVRYFHDHNLSSISIRSQSLLCGLVFTFLASVCFATSDPPTASLSSLDTFSTESLREAPKAETSTATKTETGPDAAILLQVPTEVFAPSIPSPRARTVGLRLPATRTALTTTAHSRAAARLIGPLGSLESRLLADAADGRLDHFTLLEATMIASGVNDPATIERFNTMHDSVVAQLHATLDRSLSPRLQMEAIFDFMHGHILTGGYAIQCTDPRIVFQSGRFNCVSASVLFNDLAESIGLTVVGLETPGHMMCRVFLAEGPVDVEMTCPQWFRLQHDPRNRSRAVAARLGIDPTRGDLRLREVTPIETAGMIYYNRGVELLAAKRYREALAANAKALQLDPSNETVWGNLLATLNNWAIAEGADNHHQRALALLREGRQLDPSYETFVLNVIHVYYCIADKLTRQGKYGEAIDRMDEAVRELPGRYELRRLRETAYMNLADENITRARYHEAFDIIGRYSSLVDQRLRLAEPLVVRQVDRLVKAGQNDAAVKLLDASVRHVPESRALSDRRTMLIVRLARSDADKGEFEKAVVRLSPGSGGSKIHPIVRRELSNIYNRWVQTLRRSGRFFKARQVSLRAQQDPLLNPRQRKSGKS